MTSKPWAADRRGTASRHRGATLFELLVAIGVVAVLAGIAVPWMWSRLASLEGPETAERICGMLRLARAEAIASGRLVQVRGVADPAGDGRMLRAEFIDPAAISSGEAAPIAPDALLEQIEAEFDGALDGDLDAAAASRGRRPAADGGIEAIPAAWSSLRLPPGWRLRPASEFEEAVDEDLPLPEGFLDRPDFGDLEDSSDGDGEAAFEEAPLLAIYLPDGRNLLVGVWHLERFGEAVGGPGPSRVPILLDDLMGLPRTGLLRTNMPPASEPRP
jgi:prepilin-type N-terminal cleavage/methylation domain-containing protein